LGCILRELLSALKRRLTAGGCEASSFEGSAAGAFASALPGRGISEKNCYNCYEE